MQDWEIIANQIAKAGWSYGSAAHLTEDKGAGEVRVVYVADAHRPDGHRFISRADTLLAAFIELQKMVGEAGKGQKQQVD